MAGRVHRDDEPGVTFVGEMTPNRAYAARNLPRPLRCFGGVPKRRKNGGPKHFDQLIQDVNLACDEVEKVLGESCAI